MPIHDQLMSSENISIRSKESQSEECRTGPGWGGWSNPEKNPLAPVCINKHVSQDLAESKNDQHLVDFEGSEDRSNPINWSKGYKWGIVCLLSTVNIIAYVSRIHSLHCKFSYQSNKSNQKSCNSDVSSRSSPNSARIPNH